MINKYTNSFFLTAFYDAICAQGTGMVLAAVDGIVMMSILGGAGARITYGTSYIKEKNACSENLSVGFGCPSCYDIHDCALFISNANFFFQIIFQSKSIICSIICS